VEKFQELLNIIKKYRICSDYDFDGHSLGNAHSGEIFEEKSIYTIISPELKKEARRLMLVSSELGGAELYRRTGREVDGKY
jgi:hypothetical protein